MSAPAGFDPETPFDDLPALPPAAEIETAAVLRQTVAAARALAELKGSGGLIPNQAILINAIPLQEAKLSSEIENIVTTQDELFRASLAEAVKGSPEAKEVLRYRAALHEGYLALQSGPLSLALLSRVCSTLHGAPTAFRGEGEDVSGGDRVAADPVPERDTFRGYVQISRDFGHIVTSWAQGEHEEVPCKRS